MHHDQALMGIAWCNVLVKAGAVQSESSGIVPQGCCCSCQHHGVHHTPTQAVQHPGLPGLARQALACRSTETLRPTSSKRVALNGCPAAQLTVQFSAV